HLYLSGIFERSRSWAVAPSVRVTAANVARNRREEGWFVGVVMPAFYLLALLPGCLPVSLWRPAGTNGMLRAMNRLSRQRSTEASALGTDVRPGAAPTRVRGRVLVFAFLLAVVTYLDRVCISAAAPFMIADLQLTVLQMSVVFSAFTLAYSLFEVPSGWLADVRGPRGVLTRIVLWWSGFTMLTGAGTGFWSLVTIRFLFGAGEAGAFPSMVRAFSRWFPARERGMANGVLFFGSRMGGTLAAPVALVLIRGIGWRS